MNPLVITSKVGADGVLHLNVPVGAARANQEVKVTIEAAPPRMTQQEWHAFVVRTAGIITDPTFCRHEQGAYEKRDEL